MTVYEIYDRDVKPLPASARLQLARLILDDLAPDDIPDQDHLEKLLVAGLDSGPTIEATPEYWETKRARSLGRYDPKERVP